jgi:hypothetical protein|tara:strand:+ start:3811 stop:4188 length:378 start_codon:yes stop_codon:yes gene_type:complete
MRKYIIKSEGVRERCLQDIYRLDYAIPHEVVIRPYKHVRSVEQNNLLHTWVREIANETGHTVEEIKDHLCSEFLGTKDYVGLDGSHRRRLIATSELNVEEMSALIERVAELGAAVGARLPEIRYG